MPKFSGTRRQLLIAAAPVVAAGPLAKLALAETGGAGSHVHAEMGHAEMGHAEMGHAAMGHSAVGHASRIGADVPAPGGPRDLDAILYPPPVLPHQPGRVREYT